MYKVDSLESSGQRGRADQQQGARPSVQGGGDELQPARQPQMQKCFPSSECFKKYCEKCNNATEEHEFSQAPSSIQSDMGDQ